MKMSKPARQFLRALPLALIVLAAAANAQEEATEAMDMDSKESAMAAEQTIAIMETSLGDVTFLLYADETPKPVENFVGLAEKGYYDGVIFHRIIKGFMAQGGDPTGTGRGGQSLWGENFDDEIAEGIVFDRRGQLAMANAGPGTNGSQFFITFKATGWLTGKHTIFGEVIDGMATVDAMEAGELGPGDKPVEEIKIITVRIEKRPVE